MLKFAQKFLLFLFVLASGFVLTSVFEFNEVQAGVMCCDAADKSSLAAMCASAAVPTGCGECRQTELKNPIECNALGFLNTCPPGQGCENCPLGKVATACEGPSDGSSTSSSLTCTLKAIPQETITLTPHASTRLDAEFRANQLIDYNGVGKTVSYTVGNTSVATAEPARAGGYRANNIWPPTHTTISGVSVGTTSVTLTGRVIPYNGTPAVCTTSKNINVIDFKQCYPSSSCTVVGGGDLASGKSVSCQMPAVPDTASSGYSVTYDMKCDLYRGTNKLRTVSSQLNRTSPKFGRFSVGTVASGDSLKCAFRYCLKKPGEVVCSNWGPTS